MPCIRQVASTVSMAPANRAPMLDFVPKRPLRHRTAGRKARWARPRGHADGSAGSAAGGRRLHLSVLPGDQPTGCLGSGVGRTRTGRRIGSGGGPGPALRCQYRPPTGDETLEVPCAGNRAVLIRPGQLPDPLATATG